MNDITALAQHMSVERILEIAKGGTPTIGEKERLAITALYFHQELQVCTQAFQAAGLAQLAAEDALEKAQRANAAQDDHINQQQDRIDALEKRNAELGKYAGELESHTVTVKLPSLKQTESGERYVWSDGVFNYRNDVIEILRTAGIKVIEGEGE